jgi:hypothetical protein
MQDLVFNTPWWLLLLLVGGGGFAWHVGQARSDRTVRTAGWVLVGAGVLLFALSWLVTTDRESVERQTRAVVAAVDKKDWQALTLLLDARTSLVGAYNNRDQIIDGAKKTSDAIGLGSVSITGMETKQADTLITVDLNVLSYQDYTMGRPTVTSWRFDWQNTGGGWKLARIEPLPNDQSTPEEVLHHLQKP